MNRWFVWGVVVLWIWSWPATAIAIELEGSLTQGGFAIGQAAPGSTVSLDGRPVRVAEDGTFIIGFGRRAANKAKLKILNVDGRAQTKMLSIKSRRYRISRIDGLPSRKVTPKPEDLKRIRAESALIKKIRRRDTAEAYFRSQFMWPAQGRISGVYGSQRILNGKPRRPHMGVDIAGPKGTPVMAMTDGVVTMVHQNMFFTGKTLMIDHGHGLQSVYAHLNAIAVAEGQAVKKGDVIGQIGATGRTTAPHLHWGVSWFATRLDPALIVGPMPDQGATR